MERAAEFGCGCGNEVGSQTLHIRANQRACRWSGDGLVARQSTFVLIRGLVDGMGVG